MPVQNRKPIIFYTVSRNHKIRRTSEGPQKNEEYDMIWGILTSIKLMEDSYEGRPTYKYYFNFEPPSHDCTEILQAGQSSSCARGIILSLASIPGKIRQVRIRVYKAETERSEFTNAYVEYRDNSEQEWKKIEWDKEIVEAMPASEPVMIRGREEWDDTKRLHFLEKLRKMVSEKKLEGGGPDTPGHTHPDHMGDNDMLERQSTTETKQQSPGRHTPKPSEFKLDDMDDVDDDLPF